jgi:hypothetical protein
MSAATIDRLLGDVKVAAAGGRRRLVGFCSAIRREVPIRTFNDWKDPPPGFCEIDMVAHGAPLSRGSFIQTLTMVDVAKGWAKCLPLIARDVGSLLARAHRARINGRFSLLMLEETCLVQLCSWRNRYLRGVRGLLTLGQHIARKPCCPIGPSSLHTSHKPCPMAEASGQPDKSVRRARIQTSDVLQM